MRLVSARCSRLAVIGAIILLTSSLSLEAHAPDTSYLRAEVSRNALELRFTFDLATLHRIDRLDADLDGKVSRSEAEAAAQDIAAFLQRTITVEVNNSKADLGPLQSFGWPVDVGDSIEEKDYGQTLVHFTFTTKSDKLIEDFYVLYEVFGQLGSVHRSVADIDQEGKHLEVVFTELEPDYLYDTYWQPDAAGAQVQRNAVKNRREQFQSGVRAMWEFIAFPLVLFGVGILYPRKAPLAIGLALLGWFTWDWCSRMNAMDLQLAEVGGWDLWSLPGRLGTLFGVLMSSLMAVPPMLVLRDERNHPSVIVAAWIALFMGAVDCCSLFCSCLWG